MYKNIAVAYEEDHLESARALKHAIELAEILGAPLKVLTIAQPLPAYTAFSAAADPSALQTLKQDKAAFYEAWERRITAEGEANGVAVSAHVLEGDTVRAVTTFVGSHDVDLLIVGLHKRALRISSLWSTVYSLAQDLSCRVLGVH